MREFVGFSGEWGVSLSDGTRYRAYLPGTLDTNNIGHEDRVSGKLHQDENYVENKALSAAAVIATRYTRNHTYEGKAVFSMICDRELPLDKRLFFKAERARVLALKVDGEEVPAISGSLSTPYFFEVTGLLHKGAVVELVSDNGYEGLPHDNIVYSSAATDETQTNWNGIIGDLGVEIREKTFIDSARIYPRRNADAPETNEGTCCFTLSVETDVDSAEGFDGEIVYELAELGVKASSEVFLKPGKSCIKKDIEVEVPHNHLWDICDGRLLQLKAYVAESSKDVLDERSVLLGLRFFEDKDGHLCLNGRRIFLRSEANCAVFPETGHPPMDVESWKNIIVTYMGYGVNCLRFHSHCPPEAAFLAADELGMLMQPELSHWNPRDAFSDDKAAVYYEKELKEILRAYANHPSFVMLAFGNELQAKEDGMKVSKRLLDIARSMDATRLYAFSSNPFYGEKGADADSDFYTAMRYKGLDMRATFDGMQGYLNSDYPNAMHDYSNTAAEIRKAYKKPVFSFEVGQYEVLPDFDELSDFQGVTSPGNIRLIKENVEQKGLLKSWKRRVEATGELSLLSYREEVEAALRTGEYSGISLLGLQDFPGQGTALVGMLNSHLKPKPFDFADPARFRSFFTDVLPLVYLEKYTYVESETLRAKVKLSNYSRYDVCGRLITELSDNGRILLSKEAAEEVKCSCGTVSAAGEIEIDLSALDLKKNSALELKVTLAGFSSTLRIWVYKESSQRPEKPQGIYETKRLDAEAKEILEHGGIVFLAPDSSKEQLPNSVKSCFTTDFWSVGTFASQEGTMGLLIDDRHPLFKDYPTGFHTDYQWFMQSCSRALILPQGVESIVTVMDSYAYLRNMGMLLEFNCLKGKVFVSTLGLFELKDYPECAALLSSIYRYIGSEEFRPKQSIGFEEMNAILYN